MEIQKRIGEIKKRLGDGTEFIGHPRADIPWLLEQIDRLQSELDEATLIKDVALGRIDDLVSEAESYRD